MKRAFLKYSGLSLALLSALNLTACGGATSAFDDGSSTVEVERGPVLYAHVMDASGLKAQQLLGTNQYQFTLSPAYPLSSIGGYIDMDANGTLSAGDVAMGNMQLQAFEGEKLTLASTLSHSETQLAVLESLGFTLEQLTSQTPSTDLAIAALSDEVYRYCIENSVTDLGSLDLSALQNQIATRIARYQSEGLTALQQETLLVEDLMAAGENLSVLDEAEAERLLAMDSSLSITQSSFEDVSLTEAQKILIAYSWNEEKMAKELYLNLYDAVLAQGTEIKSLYNVATNSESQHMEAMRVLLEKYNLEISQYTGQDGEIIAQGYDDEALAAVANASFPLAEIQTMYDDLWRYATFNTTNLAQSALEAGCMVEVKDVEDLNESIEAAGDALELVSAFETLRAGSYNHYWAFNNGLVQQGIDEGCCVLGEEFCRPEFPQVPKGQGNH